MASKYGWTIDGYRRGEDVHVEIRVGTLQERLYEDGLAFHPVVAFQWVLWAGGYEGMQFESPNGLTSLDDLQEMQRVVRLVSRTMIKRLPQDERAWATYKTQIGGYTPVRNMLEGLARSRWTQVVHDPRPWTWVPVDAIPDPQLGAWVMDTKAFDYHGSGPLSVMAKTAQEARDRVYQVLVERAASQDEKAVADLASWLSHGWPVKVHVGPEKAPKMTPVQAPQVEGDEKEYGFHLPAGVGPDDIWPETATTSVESSAQEAEPEASQPADPVAEEQALES